MSDANRELKIKLEQAHRILFMEGLSEDTTRGHISAKAADGTIYVKPWGVGFEEVAAHDFLGVDGGGKLKEGKGRLHSEMDIHLEIYRRRQEIRSIIHVHPFHTVLLSSLFTGQLYIISQQGYHFWGGIPVYESAELIHSRQQAENLAETMAAFPAILMRNHGVVVAGRTVEEAAIIAIDFEKAAKEHLMLSLYENPLGMPREIAKKIEPKIFNAEQYDMLWSYYCRKFTRMKG